MNGSDRATAKELLNDLIEAANRIADKEGLSHDRVMAQVEECERKIRQLRVILELPQETDATDGAEGVRAPNALRADAHLQDLMREADASLRQCVDVLSERRQAVANELNTLRLTQRATRAYQGIESG